MDDVRDTGPSIPRSTDEENVPVDTTSAEPLRKAKIEEPPEESRDEEVLNINRDDDSLYGGNPPRTTKGNFTAPKFGSAGSGGAEFEPGPERD
jgi:hypothetical protein